jgi:hypothetical protein
MVVVGLALTAFAWIVASPTGGSPDDDFHLASVWCLGPEAGVCPTVDVDGEIEVEAPGGTPAHHCYAFQPEQSAACSAAALDQAVYTTDRLNQGEYPGLYYRVMHLLAGDDLSWSVLVMRWANIALILGLLGALFALSPPEQRRLQIYTVLGSAVPLVWYYWTSINPSAWGIAGLVVSWLALTAWAQADWQRSRWRWLGLAAIGLVGAVMAAGARADCGAYLVLVAGSVGFLNWSRWRRRPQAWAVLALTAVIGLVGFLSGAQSGSLGGLGEAMERSPGAVLASNVINFPLFLGGFWGMTPSLGWLDVPLEPLAYFPALVVTVALVLVGLGSSGWRKNLMLAGFAAAIMVLPLWIWQQSLNLVGENVQTRYLAPLMAVFVGVALLRPDGRGADSLSPTQTWLMWAGVVVAQAVALHDLIRRYVTGVDVFAIDLNQNVEWWRAGGPSPMLTWVLGSVGFALAASLWFIARRQSADRPLDPTAGLRPAGPEGSEPDESELDGSGAPADGLDR